MSKEKRGKQRGRHRSQHHHQTRPQVISYMDLISGENQPLDLEKTMLYIVDCGEGKYTFRGCDKKFFAKLSADPSTRETRYWPIDIKCATSNQLNRAAIFPDPEGKLTHAVFTREQLNNFSLGIQWDAPRQFAPHQPLNSDMGFFSRQNIVPTMHLAAALVFAVGSFFQPPQLADSSRRCAKAFGLNALAHLLPPGHNMPLRFANLLLAVALTNNLAELVKLHNPESGHAMSP